jgi:hypothetical protein
MRRVILESPYAGNVLQRWLNRRYARRCVRDALQRGEAPIASHLLYTQRGILRDEVPSERKLGIDAGLAWRDAAEASVVYVDRGVSGGMMLGIQAALRAGLPVEYRTLRQNRDAPAGCNDCSPTEGLLAARVACSASAGR